VLLLSVSWLARFEPGGDLSVFVADDSKPVIPVVLRNVDEERHNLHGLEARTLFRLPVPRGTSKSFAACRSDEEKNRFAQQLSRQIEQRLHRWMATQHDLQTTPGPAQPGLCPGEFDAPNDPDARAEELM
jgi:hypothetical protein